MLLAAGLAGCSDANSPSAPQAVPAPTEVQRPAIRLRGVVSDTAFRPLAGARIEIVSGPESGKWTIADAAGGFGFTGIFDATTEVRARLNGYVDATLTLGRCVYCPDYYAYFYLAVPVPPVSIAGDYTLTFVADSACTDLPAEARTRSYTATLTAISDSSFPPNTLFNVIVGGVPFLAGRESFWIGVAGDYLAFNLEDPGLLEELATNTYVTIGGLAAATIGPAFSTITAPFDGSIEYDSPVARARCASKNHRLTLTRR